MYWLMSFVEMQAHVIILFDKNFYRFWCRIYDAFFNLMFVFY